MLRIGVVVVTAMFLLVVLLLLEHRSRVWQRWHIDVSAERDIFDGCELRDDTDAGTRIRQVVFETELYLSQFEGLYVSLLGRA